MVAYACRSSDEGSINLKITVQAGLEKYVRLYLNLRIYFYPNNNYHPQFLLLIDNIAKGFSI
jgi:hypothetical protein